MDWFEKLTGFKEQSPNQVRANLHIKKNKLKSLVNKKEYIFGTLEIASLASLRKEAFKAPFNGKIKVQEIVANVQDLHINPSNQRALFQVASQFNLLEMVTPHITPQMGVGIYEDDPTQGPACAIAAGAGTIYRNYFVPLNGEVGQSTTNQIDTLADIAKALGNNNNSLWKMQNGYALLSLEGAQKVNQHLQNLNETQKDKLRQKLKIGIQWNTQVTLANCSHLVSQAYCSALPVAYMPYEKSLLKNFATLILEAAYEATFCAAIINMQKNNNNKLFLTLLGGGAFGNDINWIIQALYRALNLFKKSNLDVSIVSYKKFNPYVKELLSKFN